MEVVFEVFNATECCRLWVFHIFFVTSHSYDILVEAIDQICIQTKIFI